MRNHLFLVSMFIGLIQGCAAAPIETQVATEPPKAIPTQAAPTSTPLPQTPSTAPVEWINTRPFLEAPPGPPELALGGLPDGFEPQDNEYQVVLLPSGREAQITPVEYQRAIGGQVYVEDSVKVVVLAHQDAEARSEHIDLLWGSDYSWEFQQVSDHLVARYYSEALDGRGWVSGPYLIFVFSHLDTSDRGPWVDTFAALYLQLYPPD